MKRPNLLPIASIVIVLSIIVLGFLGGTSPEAELGNITKDIPDNWWDGGWDKLQELQAFIAKYPAKPALCAKAQYYVGCYYHSRKEYLKAIDAYTLLIKTYSLAPTECAKAQYEIAQIYLGCLNNPTMAIQEYRKLINEYPKSPTTPIAQLMIGRAYIKLKNNTQARTELQKVIDDYPWSGRQQVEALVELGDISLSEQNPKEALSYYKKAYLTCPLGEPNTMEWIIDKIHQGFRTLDTSLARANQFIKYQKYGPRGEDKILGTEDDLTDPLAEF